MYSSDITHRTKTEISGLAADLRLVLKGGDIWLLPGENFRGPDILK